MLRLNLLLPEAAADRCVEVSAVLESELPETAHGLPVRFALTGDARVTHRVEVGTVPDFARSRIGVDPLGGLTTADWLSMTGQAVLEVTAGAVFADRHGALTRTRDALRWYPDDLWAVLVAVDWQRLKKQLPLAGRAGERGDDLGPRVIAARLVGTAMHLGFLLEQRWPPYPKWLGSVFASLPRAGAVTSDLALAVAACTWQERQPSRVGAGDAPRPAARRRAAHGHRRGAPAPSRARTSSSATRWSRPCSPALQTPRCFAPTLGAASSSGSTPSGSSRPRRSGPGSVAPGSVGPSAPTPRTRLEPL